MTPANAVPVPPVALKLLPELGRLEGSNGRYEKFVPDLHGLYRDEAAFQQLLADDDGSPVYWVERSQTEDGRSTVVEVHPGQAVYVPGHWVHRSVNVGTERFITLFCYAGDAGQDYSIIERAGGMQQLVVQSAGGWRAVPNPDHTGYAG